MEETTQKLKSLKIKKVGILATQSTINSKIYSTVLQKDNIALLYPTKPEQTEINKIIVELLNGRKNNSQAVKIKGIIDSLRKKGVECILLACTDLQLAVGEINSPISIINTTEVLIQASVRELTEK